MVDENGLELSLGLGCGGSAAKPKGKNSSSLDTRTEGDRRRKLVDDFQNFVHVSSQKQDSSSESQSSVSVKPPENFFSDLSKPNADADASVNLNNAGLWVSNGNIEIEEEKRPEPGNKRKMLFDEINTQKKRERDVHNVEQHDRKTPHISITTEDGSTAENEDVAESEVEASTSRLVSHHDDGPKTFIGLGNLSEVPKEICGFSDWSVVDLHGQKRPSGLSENEFKHGNLNGGVPFSVQRVNVMNVPYAFPVKESNSIGAPSNSGHPQTGMMQVIPTPNSDQRIGSQTVNPGDLPVMFGCPPVQLPTSDKDNSWGLVSNLQQFHSSFVGRVPPNSDKHNDSLKISQAMQVIARSSSEASQYDGRITENTKGDGKQQIVEEGSSSQTEDVKGSSMNLRAKDVFERPLDEGLSSDFSAIKPGIGTAVKFWGCGSYPNLPWVSTTSPGPNGRTISGVTYKYSANQIRVVCACHGSHMPPEEFVRHASEDGVNPDTGSGLATFPSPNPAASTQS